MAYHKNQNRSEIFTLTQLGDEILSLRKDPIQSSIMILFHILIGVEWLRTTMRVHLMQGP